MPKFENIQSTDIKQSTPSQENLGMESEFNPEAILETFEIQTKESQEAMHAVNEAVPNISNLLTEVAPSKIKSDAQEQFGGIMSKFGQKLRDTKLAKAAVVAIGLMGSTSAFAEESVNLKDNYFKDMPTVSTKKIPDRLKMGPNRSLGSVLQAVKDSNKAISNGSISKSPERSQMGHYKMSNGKMEFVPTQGVLTYGELSPTLQGQLTDPYNTIPKQKKVLPGATVNGEPIYEIAPGVYGNKHSQYGDGSPTGVIRTD